MCWLMKAVFLSLLYLNYWQKIKLQDDFIVKNIGEVAGFNGAPSKPYGRVLDIELHGKVVSMEFYLMKYNSPHNGLLNHDWTNKMGVVASSICQCLETPINNKVCKVRSYQWHTFKCKEECFDQA